MGYRDVIRYCFHYDHVWRFLSFKFVPKDLCAKISPIPTIILKVNGRCIVEIVGNLLNHEASPRRLRWTCAAVGKCHELCKKISRKPELKAAAVGMISHLSVVETTK